MIHLLRDWFGWPDGSVLTNLVAAAFGVAIGWVAAGRRIVRSHRELHQKLDGLHAKSDVLHEHVALLRKTQDGA